MNALEAYLRRASRGLPRAHGRRVREELRGSVLERAAEHQVAGHGAEHALELALREFGDPVRLARGMQRLYSVPRLTLLALTLSGLGGLITLGMIQMPRAGALAALVQPGTDLSCRPAPQTPWWAVPGAWATCKASRVTDHGVFRLADLRRALEAQGAQTRVVNTYSLYVRFPGQHREERLDLSMALHSRSGEALLDKYRLLSILDDLSVPVALRGLLNPTLMLGPLEVPLGTRAAPVHAADLFAHRALQLVTPALTHALPRGASSGLAIVGATFDERAAPRLALQNSDGQLFALVDNLDCLPEARPRCDGLMLRVRAAGGGSVPLRPNVWTGQTPALVASPAAFLNATRRGRAAVLIWQLDTRDVRDIRVRPVTGERLTPPT
ncbi:hypothetical protein HNQ07_004327 [Deinococcus metalli]|uniref:Uncharacterized protein n=1 Tax=Deinococcus metalli TaxID=1141878 RepID=A0A7W8KIJ4_9DEIO|nr:permease prefix domain 1-containing protein [Deinococcus metalli]MBB5378820.1 hypothetical protein [Deinococcus metalli]